MPIFFNGNASYIALVHSFIGSSRCFHHYAWLLTQWNDPRIQYSSIWIVLHNVTKIFLQTFLNRICTVQLSLSSIILQNTFLLKLRHVVIYACNYEMPCSGDNNNCRYQRCKYDVNGRLLFHLNPIDYWCLLNSAAKSSTWQRCNKDICWYWNATYGVLEETLNV